MTEAEEQPAAESGSDGTAAEPGRLLRAAREAQGLTHDDVAHALRLDLAVVRGIEAGELDQLGAPVFVKGYLRSYARLLELPEQEVVAAWQPAVSETQVLRSSAMQVDMKPGASLSTFISWMLLALLLLGAVIYLLGGEESSAPAAAGPAVEEPRAAAAPSRPSPRPAPRDDFVVEEVPVASVAEPPVAEPAAPEPVEPERPPAPAAINIELEFTAECWVELTAAGSRLLYGLEKTGTVRRFEAQPPLRFFVGNVDAVDIRLDGRDYSVPVDVRTGRNTARFTLERPDIEAMQ